jgi:hypothetical protein
VACKEDCDLVTANLELVLQQRRKQWPGLEFAVDVDDLLA